MMAACALIATVPAALTVLPACVGDAAPATANRARGADCSCAACVSNAVPVTGARRGGNSERVRRPVGARLRRADTCVRASRRESLVLHANSAGAGIEVSSQQRVAR
ncbi:MAG: hypothetical protein V9G20_19790 [Candidatus Promineifilaceae bacterium]